MARFVGHFSSHGGGKKQTNERGRVRCGLWFFHGSKETFCLTTLRLGVKIDKRKWEKNDRELINSNAMAHQLNSTWCRIESELLANESAINQSKSDIFVVVKIKIKMALNNVIEYRKKEILWHRHHSHLTIQFNFAFAKNLKILLHFILHQLLRQQYKIWTQNKSMYYAIFRPDPSSNSHQTITDTQYKFEKFEGIGGLRILSIMRPVIDRTFKKKFFCQST